VVLVVVEEQLTQPAVPAVEELDYTALVVMVPVEQQLQPVEVREVPLG
jgi:hypothetical protein